jgi:hypothetical protein
MAEVKLMFPRRFVRVTAAVMVIAMALAVSLGFDFHHGANITETLGDFTWNCEL